MTKKTTSKKQVAAKNAPAKKETAKKTTPKRSAKPKEDLVVFAFRLTEAERTKIHKTAGPAKASKFIRQVASAFANEDEATFRAVLKEARETRG